MKPSRKIPQRSFTFNRFVDAIYSYFVVLYTHKKCGIRAVRHLSDYFYLPVLQNITRNV